MYIQNEIRRYYSAQLFCFACLFSALLSSLAVSSAQILFCFLHLDGYIDFPFMKRERFTQNSGEWKRREETKSKKN